MCGSLAVLRHAIVSAEQMDAIGWLCEAVIGVTVGLCAEPGGGEGTWRGDALWSGGARRAVSRKMLVFKAASADNLQCVSAGLPRDGAVCGVGPMTG